MRQLTALVAGAFILAAAGSASAQNPALGAASKLLPGTRPGVLSSIQGNAVTASNAPIADTVVRLRDARFGRVISTVMSDKQGVFAFQGIDPGSYVVEVMSPANDAVLASSPVLSVSAGETASARVRLSFQIPALAGLLGNSTQTAASAVTTAAQAVTAAATSSNTIAEGLVGAAATSTTVKNAR